MYACVCVCTVSKVTFRAHNSVIFLGVSFRLFILTISWQNYLGRTVVLSVVPINVLFTCNVATWLVQTVNCCGGQCLFVVHDVILYLSLI